MSEEVTVEPSRRELAVSRAVDPARERAEMKVKAFLDAAHELLADGGDFTLQMVVERSGQSLRSFYQHFAGKHELLLALFEESIQASCRPPRRRAPRRSTTRSIASGPSSLAYHRLCLPGHRPVRRDSPCSHGPWRSSPSSCSSTTRSRRRRRSRRSCRCSTSLLDEAGRAGAIRRDLDDDVAGFVLQAIMFNAFVPAIAGTPPIEDTEQVADRLWGLLFQGLAF